MPEKDRSEKVEKVGDTLYRYSSEWIHYLESEEHWRLYWRQMKLMEPYLEAGQHLLEIGPGSGFISNYLRTKRIQVTTLDIDAAKSPDIVANITTYSFQNTYDHILGFEVFEHIPFFEFRKVLPRLASVTNGYLFLSVPRNIRVLFQVMIKAPKIGRHTITWKTLRKKITETHHFWEVDHGNTSLKELEGVIGQSGFKIHHRDEAFSRLFFALKAPEKG